MIICLVYILIYSYYILSIYQALFWILDYRNKQSRVFSLWCLSSHFFPYDKISKKNNVSKLRLVLPRRFKGFSTWSLNSIPLDPYTLRQSIIVGSMLWSNAPHFMIDRRQGQWEKQYVITSHVFQRKTTKWFSSSKEFLSICEVNVLKITCTTSCRQNCYHMSPGILQTKPQHSSLTFKGLCPFHNAKCI